MTRHLSPQEYVDAAEGVLADARRAHVDGCASCREQVVAWRQLLGDVDLATEVPEPSPLFWDHFSERVRRATATQVPVPAAVWWHAWRPMTLGALLSVAVMLMAVQVRQAPSPELHGRVEPAVAGAALAGGETLLADDGSWDLMVMMASDLSSEDLRHVAAPMTGVVDSMGMDLTPAEQQELVRLIRREMGGAE